MAHTVRALKRHRADDGKENCLGSKDFLGVISAPSKVPLATACSNTLTVPLNRGAHTPAKRKKNNPTWSLDDFRPVKELGAGRFGKVRLYKDKTFNKLVAIKEIAFSDANPFLLKTELEPHRFLTCLNHPHIVRLHGYFVVENLGIYMVMDYAENGTAYDMLRAGTQPIAEKTAARFILETSMALQCCHHHGIVHRDLKPENLLLDENHHIKLADFGWCARGPGPHGTKCGTLDYLAPEMLVEDHLRSYGHEVDLWQLGVLAYEFLFARPPFETPSMEETEERIRQGALWFPSSPSISEEAKDFIRKLLVHNPCERMKLGAVASHPWIVRHVGGAVMAASAATNGNRLLRPQRVVCGNASAGVKAAEPAKSTTNRPHWK